MKINKIRRRRGAGERAEEAERLVWGANWEIQEKPPQNRDVKGSSAQHCSICKAKKSISHH